LATRPIEPWLAAAATYWYQKNSWVLLVRAKVRDSLAGVDRMVSGGNCWNVLPDTRAYGMELGETKMEFSTEASLSRVVFR
jgi:hypothetical protein